MPDRAPDESRLIGQRIIVIGNTSTGKSTVAARLADLIGGKHIELDALHWLPDWQKPADEDFEAAIRLAVDEAPRWTTSGNYLRHTLAITWPLADTLIWLDLPLRTIVPRVISRNWRRWRNNELLWGTNREDFSRHLKLWDQQESLISFAIRQQRPKQRQHTALLADPRWSHLQRHHLRSTAEVARFLEQVEREVAHA